ncbi:hypothetical protein [Persicitalea jodogahamensis]|uniref:Uncharacterized protein n=1 Tax=Persicitalea jodogahamensis TaxID=402147 RepID=A0A8J3D866_9BACT|nr:hypothetical protein [Persicitalea jodogahamensis]GHB64221.1 hypothetical protein GCM10007390_17630 [Persicitalea jodogahamensis]
MDVTEEIAKRFEGEVVDACDRIFSEGVRQMRYDMEQAGVVLTEELKRSLYSERTFVTGQLEAQFRMGMRGYGRFKDMKKVIYSKFPDVDGLIDFIEGVGVEKFINNDTVTIGAKSVTLFVPGYFINSRRRVALTVERATTRLVYAFGRDRLIRNTIKRSKNPFYNVNKGNIYNDIAKYLMEKLPADMMEALKEYYEKPFFGKGDWWE